MGCPCMLAHVSQPEIIRIIRVQRAFLGFGIAANHLLLQDKCYPAAIDAGPIFASWRLLGKGSPKSFSESSTIFMQRTIPEGAIESTIFAEKIVLLRGIQCLLFVL